jgi:hypothetical protein
MPMCGTQKHFAVNVQNQKSVCDRATRYRRLALVAGDDTLAELLYSLADEAEQKVLCTADWLRAEIRLGRPKSGHLASLRSVTRQQFLDHRHNKAGIVGHFGCPALASSRGNARTR